MCIKKIKNLVEKDLICVDNNIRVNLNSNISLINNVSDYIIMHGGKRIRPLVTILLSKVLGYSGDKHIVLAGAVELIHIATLLHDDVVDFSDKRHGVLTVNKTWGNKEAILVGDFLYTRSFQMMVSANNLKLLAVMADTTNIMSEGEVSQLVNRRNFKISEIEYLNIIRCKTAQLFSVSTSVGAILKAVKYESYNFAVSYGLHLGMAYQLIDDVLDYIIGNEKFGKNFGDDFFDGVFTLPLIFALNKSSNKERENVMRILNNYDKENFFEIYDFVMHAKAIEYTINKAKSEINKAREALSNLPKSVYLDAAYDLADFVINRTY